MTISPTPTRTAIAAAILLLAIATPALADGILLESYGGERPADAEALVAPIRDELAGRGYRTGSALGQQIESKLSKTATLLPEPRLEEAAKFIRSGFDQHLSGNWGIAARELEHGVELLLSAPLSMINEQTQRDQLFDALVALARSQKELGSNENSKRALAELLRTFPKQELSRAKYPPVVHKLYRDTAEEIRLRGLGSLQVRVDNGVMVFVNERFIGLGDVSLTNLVPGDYRVYIQQGERSGRIHEVVVPAGAEATLPIHWRIDGSLRSLGVFVGFAFENEAAREAAEAANAVEVARAVNADNLAVVGIREHNGRRSIVGTVLSMETGKVVRSATISVEPIPPSAERIRALGRFLAGDEEAAQLLGDGGSIGSVPSPKNRRRELDPWYADKLGWTLLAGGVVVGAVGGGFLVSASGLDDDAASEPDQEERQRLLDKASDRRTIGTVLAITSGVTLLAGAVKLWIHPQQRQSTGLVFSVGASTILVHGRF